MLDDTATVFKRALGKFCSQMLAIIRLEKHPTAGFSRLHQSSIQNSLPPSVFFRLKTQSMPRFLMAFSTFFSSAFTASATSSDLVASILLASALHASQSLSKNRRE